MKNTKNVFEIILLFLLNGSCSLPPKIRPSGKITKLTIPISDFSGIHIRNGIQLFVTMDTNEKIEIEADGNIQSLITATKSGNIVDIRLNRNVNFRPGQVVKVFVSAKKLNEIAANSGCKVTLTNPLDSNEFNLEITEGSAFTGSFIITTLNAKVREGSKIKLNGSTDKFNLTSSEGCQINDLNFVSDFLDCKISNGTIVNTTVNRSIDVTAREGAILNYKGKAIINSKTISNGGQINKL